MRQQAEGHRNLTNANSKARPPPDFPSTPNKKCNGVEMTHAKRSDTDKKHFTRHLEAQSNLRTMVSPKGNSNKNSMEEINMKEPYETQEIFMRMFSISEEDAKILLEFSKDFRSVLNPWEKKFPWHLVLCLPWLTRDITGHILPEPWGELKKTSVGETTPLYKVFSVDPDEGILIEWVYYDQRKKPLVNYLEEIPLRMFLNTDGLIFFMDALDQCFSEKEAVMVANYLNRLCGDQAQARIEKIASPVSPEIRNAKFDLSCGYGWINLFENEGYDLPFKVQGVYERTH